MCDDIARARAFMKRVDVNPNDGRFTIDSDPKRVELDNPNDKAERIYDQFSKLAPCSQLKILKELEKSRQFQAMRNLIFHAVPDTAPDEYCSTSSNIVRAIIADRYRGVAFPATGDFSKWLNKVGSNKARKSIKRAIETVPSHLKLGIDYEIFCFFNHFNELSKMYLIFQEKHYPNYERSWALYLEFKRAFESYPIGSPGMGQVWKHVTPTRLKGKLFSIVFSSVAVRAKHTKSDLALIEALDKAVRNSYNFLEGKKYLTPEAISSLTADGGIVNGFAFSARPKSGPPTQEGFDELKRLVTKKLERANKLIAPVKYSINKLSKIQKSGGKPDYYIVHINKKGPQEWDKYPFLDCPRRFRIEGDVKNGFTFTETPYRSR